MDDTYEGLGPEMRARLDRAEMDMAKVRDYIGLMAEATMDNDLGAHFHAGALYLLLGLAPPRPRMTR